MARRKYEQVLRAQGAEEKRRRILDAVAQQLRDGPTEPLSLDRVAQSAGVSRSTIYTDFGSRAGLFDAFVFDLWERTGSTALSEAVADPDARRHLRNGIAAASRMKAQELDIYRVLHAMDRLSAVSASGSVQTMERSRRGGMEHLAQHLHDDGLLREDVTVQSAIDILWTVTSFENLDLLITDRGLSLDDAIDTLITIAERTLCRPADRPTATRHQGPRRPRSSTTR